VLAVVKYFLARLVLFAAVVAVLALLGAGRLLALVGGVLISALLSYLLLRRLRDASTIAIVDGVQGRMQRRAARGDEDALVEDEQVERALRDADSAG
jgi:membrane protein implicated in regulation of membrane protease activity